MRRTEFEQLVEEALEAVPPPFAERLWNLEVLVEPEPSREDLEEMGLWPHSTLLGLYRGVPLTQRGASASGGVPDVITIYQGPIERESRGDEEAIRQQVRATVLHEVAHYFGISDERLEELGRA